MIKRILDKIRSWFKATWLSEEAILSADIARLDRDEPGWDSQKKLEIPAVTIKVYVGDKLIGAIQSLTINESRLIKEEPSTTSVNLLAYRVRFSKQRVAEAFDKGFVHVAAQSYPLQIEIEDDEAITTIENAWITSIDESYHTNDWVIMNAAKLEAEKISSKKK